MEHATAYHNRLGPAFETSTDLFKHPQKPRRRGGAGDGRATHVLTAPLLPPIFNSQFSFPSLQSPTPAAHAPRIHTPGRAFHAHPTHTPHHHRTA